MTWTYSNDPANVQLDAVRLEIGDTDTTDQLLSDEELNYFITREGSTFGAALAAAKVLSAKFARLVDKSVGDLRISYSQRKAAYDSLVARLQTEQSTRVAEPIVTGTSRDRKESRREEEDRVQPAFRRDQFRHPGTPQLDELCDDER